jgi:LmbE family N-acetylglucosaminyl deacetylase
MPANPFCKDTARRWLRNLLRAGLRLRARPLPQPEPAVTLVIAPHQDDETLGCGGLIVRRRLQARSVHVVFITDGSGSHPGHWELTPAELARRRRHEAGEALARLGVPPDAQHFLDAPDGRLPHLDATAAGRLVDCLTRLMVQTQPDEIFLPYRHDGSSEHVAAFALAARALTRSGVQTRVYEYPVWAWWSPRLLMRPLLAAHAVFRLPLDGAGLRKREALHCYITQVQPTPPATAAVLSADFVALFSEPEEYYFQARP